MKLSLDSANAKLSKYELYFNMGKDSSGVFLASGMTATVAITSIILGRYLFGFTILALAVLVAVISYPKSYQACTDIELEAAFARYFISKKAFALRQLEIAEKDLISKPVWFWHPSIIDRNIIKYVIGEDRRVRCNMRGFVMIFMTEHKICTFEVSKCILTNLESEFSTSEYYYDSISGIEVSQDSGFTIRTYGGSKSYKINDPMNNSLYVDMNDIRSVVSTLRGVIKSKKSMMI